MHDPTTRLLSRLRYVRTGNIRAPRISSDVQGVNTVGNSAAVAVALLVAGVVVARASSKDSCPAYH
jgi:hypothetical protein